VFWVFLGGTITPIPYKVFTIAAGACKMPLLLFFIGSLIGRSSRFFFVASMFYFFGPAIKVWIEKYFNILAIVFTVLLVGGFVAMKYLVK
jgi:membrane protein DedA with SNARE-associated domain